MIVMREFASLIDHDGKHVANQCHQIRIDSTIRYRRSKDQGSDRSPGDTQLRFVYFSNAKRPCTLAKKVVVRSGCEVTVGLWIARGKRSGNWAGNAISIALSGAPWVVADSICRAARREFVVAESPAQVSTPA